MADLVAAGNSYNPALIVLRDKGYKVWAEVDGDGLLWCATRDDREFMGYSPPELLGICCVWETLGEGWNIQEPNLFKELTRDNSD
jgi:hypothetical protein